MATQFSTQAFANQPTLKLANKSRARNNEINSILQDVKISDIKEALSSTKIFLTKIAYHDTALFFSFGRKKIYDQLLSDLIEAESQLVAAERKCGSNALARLCMFRKNRGNGGTNEEIKETNYYINVIDNVLNNSVSATNILRLLSENNLQNPFLKYVFNKNQKISTYLSLGDDHTTMDRLTDYWSTAYAYECVLYLSELLQGEVISNYQYHIKQLDDNLFTILHSRNLHRKENTFCKDLAKHVTAIKSEIFASFKKCFLLRSREIHNLQRIFKEGILRSTNYEHEINQQTHSPTMPSIFFPLGSSVDLISKKNKENFSKVESLSKIDDLMEYASGSRGCIEIAEHFSNFISSYYSWRESSVKDVVKLLDDYLDLLRMSLDEIEGLYTRKWNSEIFVQNLLEQCQKDYAELESLLLPLVEVDCRNQQLSESDIEYAIEIAERFSNFFNYIHNYMVKVVPRHLLMKRRPNVLLNANNEY